MADAAQSQVTQAQGKLVQAEANFRYAQTAPRQMQISRSRAESAEAQVLQKKAALDQAQLNLQYTKLSLRSPAWSAIAPSKSDKTSLPARS
jgi:membrane fusion protein, multidrug efflux system